MIFGVLKDIKAGESRVIATPLEVGTIISDGPYSFLVQKDAGIRAGFSNEDYEEQGAEIVEKLEEMYERSDLLAKVKEIEEIEYKLLLRENQIIFTCIHPAANPQEVQAILDSKCIALQQKIHIDSAR